MNKQLLKDILIDQHAEVVRQPLIFRGIYKKIKQLSESKQILIIAGLRRCGKSTLLSQLRQESQEKDYFINFDDDRLVNFELKDFQMLYETFIELYGLQRTFFFDEIQNISHWERFIRRLYDQGNKIYITGSNASMLSAELGTRLTGRYIEIKLYPYSFLEFLDYKKLPELKSLNLTTAQKGGIKAVFNEFIQLGGLPEYLESKQREYLHALYESILYKDIIVRHRISNHHAIKELVYYLASNIGKECSFNSLKKIFGLSSASTLSNYCSYLQDSFLCYFINRFDYSLKKQLQNPKKIYFVDQALAMNVGFRFSKDQGRLLENIVFLELKRRGHEIYFHAGKKECDFLLREGTTITTAIQVCIDLSDEKTKSREVSGLIDAMETYHLSSGLIITEDETFDEIILINNKTFTIKVVSAWSWLRTNC